MCEQAGHLDMGETECSHDKDVILLSVISKHPALVENSTQGSDSLKPITVK